MSGRGRGGRRHRGQGLLSMAEKRMLVKQGTHRWCSGMGSCHGKGTLPGSKLPHAACKGDGLIKLRNPRGGRRPGGNPRPGKGKRGPGLVGGAVISGSAAWIASVNVFGETLGPIVAIVAMVIMTALWVLGGVAQAFGLVSK